MKNHRSLLYFPLLLLAIHFVSANGEVAAAIEPDFLMDSDPAFRAPQPLKNFPDDFKRLWISALERPEIDMQRMAAETIARAHQHEFPQLIEAVPQLEIILLRETSHPAARFAAARALIVLKARDSSEKLLLASQEFGADLRQLVEPALAKWDFVPARTAWIKRLDAHETRPRDLLLAIRGLGQVHETSVLPVLLKIVADPVRSNDIRLEAAIAAGQLAESGLEQEADRLSHEVGPPKSVTRLSAIRLLARHDSETARRQLIEFSSDDEPVVAAAALSRLNQIDPVLVLPMADSAMNNPDASVRTQGAAAYVRLATPERVSRLSQLLNDPHPDIRRSVCESLLSMADKPELNEPVHQSAMHILTSDHWQGQEQASLLLGTLEHRPAAKRLVELLESSRAEVKVASAWALRKVAVPETIPAIVDKARRLATDARQLREPGIDDQIAHLFETCGKMKVTDLEPLMTGFVPYASRMGERSRGAAIWSLGLFHAGTPVPRLSEAMITCVNDFDSRPGESLLVKRQCVVALGRMKAIDQTASIQKFLANGTPPSSLGLAMRWAVKELTGEELPEPIPQNADPGSWFLEPLP